MRWRSLICALALLAGAPLLAPGPASARSATSVSWTHHRHVRAPRHVRAQRRHRRRARHVSAVAGASPPRLFAADSVWNQPLSPDAPVDPSSPARVAALLKVMRQPGHGPWINTYQYSVPIYRVPAGQPTVQVKLDGWSPALARAWQAVPVPAAAAPAGGTDGIVVIYQPATDRMWEFWQFSHRSDGFHARWGGAMQDVSTNPGYYSPAAWPGASDQGWSWGATATSLPEISGVMTIAELRAGRIDHALAVAPAQACAGWFVWPAQRTDGQSSDPDCLPEGAHLRLDPRLDLSKLGLPRIALTVAEAMQKYGIIVRDTTNSSFGFSAEQPTSGPDPFYGPDGVFDQLPEWRFLPMIPWDHLQLLKLGSPCTSGPCKRRVPAAARRVTASPP